MLSTAEHLPNIHKTAFHPQHCQKKKKKYEKGKHCKNTVAVSVPVGLAFSA